MTQYYYFNSRAEDIVDRNPVDLILAVAVGQEIGNPLWLSFTDTSAAALHLDLPFPHVSRSVADSGLGAPGVLSRVVCLVSILATPGVLALLALLSLPQVWGN